MSTYALQWEAVNRPMLWKKPLRYALTQDHYQHWPLKPHINKLQQLKSNTKENYYCSKSNALQNEVSTKCSLKQACQIRLTCARKLSRGSWAQRRHSPALPILNEHQLRGNTVDSIERR